MSIRGYRTLVAIHREGSFRAAANSENLTASAVSHQMKALEAALGFALFDRTLKSPTLTQIGLTLVGEAAKLLEVYDALPAIVSATEDVSGEITLGAVPTTLTGLVPKALSELKSCHPKLRVRLVPGLSNQLLLQLDRGQIHAALISRPEILPGAVVFSPIASEELVLLVAEGMEGRAPEDLLRTEPFIRFTRDAVVGRQIETWLQKRGISVFDAMELEGLEAISSMVSANLGVSIVPRSCLGETGQPSLKRFPLGKDAPVRDLGLASPKSSSRARVIDAVATALKAVVPDGVSQSP